MEANIILGLLALFGIILAVGKTQAEKIEKEQGYCDLSKKE